MFRLTKLLWLVFVLVFTDDVAALGGKSFFINQRSILAKENYAFLTACYPQEKAFLNVTLFLNPLEQNEVINFSRAGFPFKISSNIQNVTQVTIEAPSLQVPLNIMQITFRIGKSLYKLMLNPKCDTDEKFWTLPDMTSYWGRFIDCTEADTFCDPRTDEISDCDGMFTYYVMWRDGVDRYE
uniref:CW domain-containing protein n=1 Tax=Haemonchus contortus TaxID=6289 RepID=A0A7I4Y5A3_HAECO